MQVAGNYRGWFSRPCSSLKYRFESVLKIGVFEFRICFGFRASNFEFVRFLPISYTCSPRNYNCSPLNCSLKPEMNPFKPNLFGFASTRILSTSVSSAIRLWRTVAKKTFYISICVICGICGSKI